jgi:transcriptional antiterminator RfaH
MDRLSEIKAARSKQWRVLYTRPRWEKKVNGLLQQKGIESYCPLIKKESQWADRKKTVEWPLFSAYLFVRVNAREELAVRETTGVINFVYHCGKPAILHESIIEDVRSYLLMYDDLETVRIPDLKVGDTVKITNGAFTDHTGEIVKLEGKKVLMVLEHLDCALITKVPVRDVNLVG